MALTIVITGSSKGIGLGLARYFHEQGHEIVLNGRNPDKLMQVFDSFENKSRILFFAGNIAEEETHIKLIESAHSKFGKIDLWINNAGVPQPYKLFSELSNEDIDSLLNINLLGLMKGTISAFRYMSDQGHGKIFNLAGFGSDGRMIDKLTLYGTSKRAVSYFTESFYKEHKNSPVHIGLINPGMTKTDFINIDHKMQTEDEKKQFEKVYRIMAEDLDTVIQNIGPRILNSQKAFNKVYFPTGFKLMTKIFKLIIS